MRKWSITWELTQCTIILEIRMTTDKLLKILDNTFPDVEFDIFTDIEGLVRVNFCVDEENEDD
tara:strand:- start:966 stop:1154 length:189 start_codon:yes stop_codon:yes gene_type:complete